MKTADVVIGGVYHDGKVGVREVVSMVGDHLRVTYRILAAKVEQEYSYADKKMIPTIGTTSSCDLASFAQWAKTKLDGDGECQKLLTDLSAKKLRLAPGERAFMNSVSRAAGYPTEGTTVSYSFNETRQARGIEKKGLAAVSAGRSGCGGEITLTALGAAWCRVPNNKLQEAR